MSDEDDWIPEEVQLPITPELDLHLFSPQEMESLLESYFEACLEEGIFRIRVIHGKGTGALRDRVHHYCERSIQAGREVQEFHYPAGLNDGSWGATWVHLRAPSS